MTPLLNLLPDVLLSCSGCPTAVATQALSSATREFLYDTNAWKQWSANEDVIADEALYTFTNHLDTNAQRWARTKEIDILRWLPTGRDLVFKTQEQLQAHDPKWRERSAAVPAAYTYEWNEASWGRTVQLYPRPSVDVAAALQARMIIVTHTYAGLGVDAYDAQEVSLPDHIFQAYRDALVAGALGRLYKMPKRDWTDRNEAAYQDSIFNAAKVSAKSEADLDYGPGVVTVAYGGL